MPKCLLHSLFLVENKQFLLQIRYKEIKISGATNHAKR